MTENAGFLQPLGQPSAPPLPTVQTWRGEGGAGVLIRLTGEGGQSQKQRRGRAGRRVQGPWHSQGAEELEEQFGD